TLSYPCVSRRFHANGNAGRCASFGTTMTSSRAVLGGICFSSCGERGAWNDGLCGKLRRERKIQRCVVFVLFLNLHFVLNGWLSSVMLYVSVCGNIFVWNNRHVGVVAHQRDHCFFAVHLFPHLLSRLKKVTCCVDHGQKGPSVA
ncbi:unnamed protein product, partial [Ectocarpus sp. 8 AP-2014]